MPLLGQSVRVAGTSSQTSPAFSPLQDGGIMRHKVRINKNHLDYFRKLSRETDKEIQSYLIGRVISSDITAIEKIAHVNGYELQTTSEVCWFTEDVDAAKKDAEERGLKIVGDIHSHPNWWPVLSPCDHKNHLKEGQRISGICSVMNGKTKVYFWLAETSLPCEIVYV